MSTQIVTVNVSQTVAPAPSTLQSTGALISQGATTGAVGSLALLTQLSDLTPLLTGAKSIASLTWSSGTVTVGTTSPHGFTISDTITLTIAGCAPAGYNGTFLCTITGTSSFTYPLGTNPGAATTQGTYTPEDVAELLAMATTFFAQSNTISVYVLELGAGNASDGVTALTAFIAANPSTIYSYLVPRYWAAASSYLTFLASYESTTAQTYFFTTMTTGNYTSFTALMKCVVGLIEAPGIPTTEFSLAAAFQVSLSYAPSSLAQVTPFAYSFLSGVTPYPTVGNAALFQTLKNAGVNIVGTGAEGGISNTILLWGTTMDLRQFNYWYSVDWVQINVNIDLSNEIINGSNNPQAPLYYNQAGINRLQQRAQGTMNRGVAYGLVLPPVNVTAVPFATYVAANPSNYKNGIYNGLAVTYTPQRGFEQITFYVNVSDFPQS